MSTYSIGTPPTDALKLQDLNSVLGALPDNTSKLISPKDVRDAVYTLWENIIFKPTSNNGGTEYIGIDKSDFRRKVYIGKKTVGGTPVLSEDLLSTNPLIDVDVFFYNTKSEPQSDYSTTVAFLSGTGPNYQSGQLAAPHIVSRPVTNAPFDNTIDLEINNTSYYLDGLTGYGGNISLKSLWGNVVLNDLRFPTSIENLAATDGDVLKYKVIGGFPTAYWEEAVTASSDNLFSTGTVTIDGSPVLLNGLPIDFSYSVPTPVAIGGIPAGSTFSGVPVTEMIKRLLYPYIAPEVTSFLDPILIESGDAAAAASLSFNFSILKNATYSISSVIYNFATTSTITPTPVPISNIPNLLSSYSYGAPVNSSLTSTQSYSSQTYSVTVTDTYPTSVTSTSSLYVVIPWYYGTATISATQNVGINTINSILGTVSSYVSGKLTPILTDPVLSVTSSYNKTLNLTTAGLTVNTSNQGYVYFGYPADFPDLDSILDPNGYDCTPSFERFVVTDVQHPNAQWNGKTYKFYIFVGSTGSTNPVVTTTGAPPFYNGDFKFNFA